MELHERIIIIEERNDRVEKDKAWETSLTRKLAIAFFTYVLIVLFFIIAALPNPFINPIVPTVGFVLSTLSMPYIRRLWERNQ